MRRISRYSAHACSPWAVFLPRSHRRREGCIPYYNTPFDPKLQLGKAFRPNRFVFSVFMPFFFGFCGSFCRWYFLCRRFLCRRPFRPPRFQHKMKMPRPSRFFKTDDARGGGQNHLAARGHIVPLRHNLPSGGFAAAKPKKIGGILMAHYAVRESPPLRGEIPISTSKNACCPSCAARC